MCSVTTFLSMHDTCGPYASNASLNYDGFNSDLWEASLSTSDNSPLLPYPDSYLTPQPSSAIGFTQLSHQDFVESIEPCTAPHAMHVPAVVPVASHNGVGSHARSHSSPSNFRPYADELVWTGNSFKQEQYDGSDSSLASDYPSSQLPSPRSHARNFSSSSVGQLPDPQPQRFYAPIAPNPMGLVGLHTRKRSIADEVGSTPAKRSRCSSSPQLGAELTEEDRLLLKLKDDDNLPWKDIAARFSSDMGKAYQVPALQMRLKRLRERIRVWTDTDVYALRMAVEYWEKSKYEIISSKMIDFGATEKWPSKACARKWQEIGFTTDMYASQAAQTPGFSYTPSPIDGPPAYASFLGIPA